MVFEELHAAEPAVVSQQEQRRDKSSASQTVRIFDQIVLFFSEQRKDQNRPRAAAR